MMGGKLKNLYKDCGIWIIVVGGIVLITSAVYPCDVKLSILIGTIGLLIIGIGVCKLLKELDRK